MSIVFGMQVSRKQMGTCNHKIQLTHKANYRNFSFVAVSLEQ
jgi:hypothetical protein